MFEKSATDLIRGLRKHKYSKEYVQKSIQQINQEIVNQNRMNAIQKLLVLRLLGVDLQQYAFHIIQSMSLKQEKKVGYLAASVSFGQDTPALIMATNLIKKDLKSNDVEEGLMALFTLAQIVTHDLARDLYQDVIVMLSNSNPYVRCRAIVVLYRMFLKYPECLVEAFPKLRDRLEDDDPMVVTCCVSVICELGRMNPKAYLTMAPQLFGIFIGSSNNWMLIKLIKLFGILAPLEPRLIRKLLSPLKKIIQNTKALSVVYECVDASIVGGLLDPEVGDEEIVQLCVEKLQMFLGQKDQMLKYLGLNALSKLMHIRPDIVTQHRQMIIQCLEDGDMGIRMQALDLIPGLITPKTLFGIVKRLLVTLANSEGGIFTLEEIKYRTMVGKSIITACSNDMYSNLSNFEWYLQVLVDLAKFPGVDVANDIKDQLLDVCMRVTEIRGFACDLMIPLLNDPRLLNISSDSIHMCDVLVAAGWICGEYGAFDDEEAMNLIAFLLSPSVLTTSPQVQACYLSAFLKVFIRSNLSNEYTTQVEKFAQSAHLEIQERANFIIEIIERCRPGETDGDNPWQGNDFLGCENLRKVFGLELDPVSESAQQKVPIDANLNLNDWLEPLELNGFDFIEKHSIYDAPPKTAIEQLDLTNFYLDGNSPAKSSKLESGQETMERPSLDEPVIADKSIDRFSSVLYRPVVKKYALKLNQDDVQSTGAPTVDHSPVLVEPKKKKEKSEKKEKKDKKKKKHKEKRRESMLDTLNFGKYTVWQNDQFFVELTLKEHPMDIFERVQLDLEFFLTVNTPSAPRSKFEVVVDLPNVEAENCGDHAVLHIKLERDSVTSWFFGEVQATIKFNNESYHVNFRLPFAINVLLPNHLHVATMTPQKFMETLQNPASPFSAVGTSTLLPPTSMSVAIAIENIASQISCIIVERHPGVVSLFGQTCNGISIFGLLKEKRNKAGRLCLAMDIKTGDTVVLEWIMETLSTLSSDWLES